MQSTTTKNSKTVPIRTRIDRDIFATAKNKANLAGLSFAQFVRLAIEAFNPPPQSSHAQDVLATVQELNSIAVNFRQIAAATEGAASDLSANLAEKFADKITAATTGRFGPLPPHSIDLIREQGQIINQQAKAANAGKPVDLDVLRASVTEIQSIPTK